MPWSRTTGAMTSATAPVAAEIIAGRPPRKAMETAIVNEANSPTRGSTPAMMENEIASGISARATTRPARTSVRSILGERRALPTVGCSDGAVVLTGVLVSVRAAGRTTHHGRIDLADGAGSLGGTSMVPPSRSARPYPYVTLLLSFARGLGQPRMVGRVDADREAVDGVPGPGQLVELARPAPRCGPRTRRPAPRGAGHAG